MAGIDDGSPLAGLTLVGLRITEAAYPLVAPLVWGATSLSVRRSVGAVPDNNSEEEVGAVRFKLLTYDHEIGGLPARLTLAVNSNPAFGLSEIRVEWPGAAAAFYEALIGGLRRRAYQAVQTPESAVFRTDRLQIIIYRSGAKKTVGATVFGLRPSI